MRAGAPRGSAVALGLWLAACGGGETRATGQPHDEVPQDPTAEQTLRDADGREVTVSVPVTRVVSLVPSATLTLDAIGARSVVVARTDFDSATWAADLPSVGGGLDPSIEAIVAARPDLVIRFGGPQDVHTPTRLDDLGIPHLAIRPDRIDDVIETIHLLGRLTRHEASADSVASGIRAVLDSVHDAAADRPPTRVVYVLGGTPPWVAGPGTYLDELIGLAGGVNVFSDLEKLYASVSPEAFITRDIDLVLLSQGASFDRSLAHGAPVREVGSWVEVPGPAVADAARLIVRMLHTELP